MNLPRISIARPVLASMMSLALVLFGLISLTRLPVRELPDIDPPILAKADADSNPIFGLSISSDHRSQLELSSYADSLKERLQKAGQLLLTKK